ncbi:MAG: nucleotide-binding protein [Dermatophilaceae bacterium]
MGCSSRGHTPHTCTVGRDGYWLGEKGETELSEKRQRDARKVFVIHGRNEPARASFFAFLRAIGLEPIEWAEAIHATGQGSPYIGEVLDAAFEGAQAVVVLQTPDDVSYLHESLTFPGDPECKPQMQPRPNVLFEAGMAFGRNPDRTILVELGQVKAFSDIHGRHVLRLDNSVKKRQDLANRLRTAGCDVNVTGSDWHEAGDLTPPAPPGGGLPLGRKLPSTEATGQPRLEARLERRSGNTLDEVVVTNHGPGDAFNVDIEAEETEGLITRQQGGFPVPRLPAGKSVKAMRTKSLAHGHSPYFTVKITATTADGTPVDVEEFVS